MWHCHIGSHNIFPIMPPLRSTDGLRDVAPAWAGRAALTEEQLDDIVAYLGTLGRP